MMLLMTLAGVQPNAPAPDVTGIYELRGEMEMASQLEVLADGTFRWGLAYGAADYWSRGKWKLEDGAVVLDSDKPKGPPFRYLRAHDEKSGHGVTIWVRNAAGRGISLVQVVLRDKQGKLYERTTQDDGKAAFEEAGVPQSVRLGVDMFDVVAGPFDLDATKSDFDFEIDVEAISQIVFSHERLELDGHDLLFRYRNPPHPMRYVRTRPE